MAYTQQYNKHITKITSIENLEKLIYRMIQQVLMFIALILLLTCKYVLIAVVCMPMACISVADCVSSLQCFINLKTGLNFKGLMWFFIQQMFLILPWRLMINDRSLERFCASCVKEFHIILFNGFIRQYICLAYL